MLLKFLLPISCKNWQPVAPRLLAKIKCKTSNLSPSCSCPHFYSFPFMDVEYVRRSLLGSLQVNMFQQLLGN